jgi:integrase
MEERGLTASTLNDVAASAISDLFRYDNVSPTLDPLVRATKKVIGRLAKKGKGGKLPLPRSLLEDFVAMMDPRSLKDIRDVFLFIMMFGGMLRGSEAAALKTDRVWVEDGNLYIFVEKSKSDQDSHGATIVLAGCPTSHLCPVSWFEIYSKERPQGAFLLHNTKEPGKKLSAKRPNALLKEWLGKAGVPKKDRASFGSHSLRKGGATAAATEKVRMHVLKRHGRWKSDAVYLYIVDSQVEQLSVSRAVLGFD